MFACVCVVLWLCLSSLPVRCTTVRFCARLRMLLRVFVGASGQWLRFWGMCSCVRTEPLVFNVHTDMLANLWDRLNWISQQQTTHLQIAFPSTCLKIRARVCLKPEIFVQHKNALFLGRIRMSEKIKPPEGSNTKRIIWRRCPFTHSLHAHDDAPNTHTHPQTHTQKDKTFHVYTHTYTLSFICVTHPI